MLPSSRTTSCKHSRRRYLQRLPSWTTSDPESRYLTESSTWIHYLARAGLQPDVNNQHTGTLSHSPLCDNSPGIHYVFLKVLHTQDDHMLHDPTKYFELEQRTKPRSRNVLHEPWWKRTRRYKWQKTCIFRLSKPLSIEHLSCNSYQQITRNQASCNFANSAFPKYGNQDQTRYRVLSTTIICIRAPRETVNFQFMHIHFVR